MHIIYILLGLLTIVEANIPVKYLSGFGNPRTYSTASGVATCICGLIPVKATTTLNEKLNFKAPRNQSQVTEAFLNMMSTGSNFSQHIAGPKATISGTYNISSTVCYPRSSGINSSTVQFLTHGLGFGGSYWNFADGYSFVDVAAMKGYTTFFYDRLGVGLSDHPNAIQIVQTPLELAIAQSLIKMLRGGAIASTIFDNVVGVGHSFGSLLTTGIASASPKLLDAVVLTGFSVNMSATPIFYSALNLALANENQPDRFSNLGNGYLVSNTIISNQFDFFRAPNYDPALLQLAEATKGTITFGEFFTLSAIAKPATNYTGPLDVVNGEKDFPFCAGDCLIPDNLAEAVGPALFPKARNLANYIAPGAGHALNLHYSAGLAFDHIQKFIMRNGL